MRITVEHKEVEENEVILRCKSIDEEMLHILSLLKSRNQKLCGFHNKSELIFLEPNVVLYCESVDDKVFLYTKEQVLETTLNLMELECSYSYFGYVRISKAMVVNLHQIDRLRSLTSGKIEMDKFNKFYRFGSEIKPKAALYSLGILFFIGITNLICGITTIDIFTIIETFIVALFIALIEYKSFKNYEYTTKENKTKINIVWLITTNVIIIFSAIVLKWFQILPTWGYIMLVLALECALVAMRYSIYVMNMLDTRNLNSKLEKFQKEKV